MRHLLRVVVAVMLLTLTGCSQQPTNLSLFERAEAGEASAQS